MEAFFIMMEHWRLDVEMDPILILKDTRTVMGGSTGKKNRLSFLYGEVFIRKEEIALNRKPIRVGIRILQWRNIFYSSDATIRIWNGIPAIIPH